MSNVGQYLKKTRLALNRSLKNVYFATGISDSILSRIENGDNGEPSPGQLKKLSVLYGISVIDLYLMCGYVDQNDLKQFQQCFNGVYSLTDEEKQLIQKQIDIFNRKNEVVANDI